MKEFYEFALIVQKDQYAISLIDEIDAHSVHGSFVVEKVLTNLMNLGESIPSSLSEHQLVRLFRAVEHDAIGLDRLCQETTLDNAIDAVLGVQTVLR
ncbi:MAG: hypothetical protein ACOX2M_03415 [Fastidiosipilaceae bacterium]|jgi:hypothetical protein